MSKAEDIAVVLAQRLAQVRTDAGYATDIGARVFRGRRSIDPDHVPCITLIEADDLSTPKDGMRSTEHKVVLRFVAEAHAECDANNPNIIGNAIVADLKRALFGLKDPQLGGLAKALRYRGRSILPREGGIAIVAAAVEFEVEHHEDLAAP